jgi:hypothetical protein
MIAENNQRQHLGQSMAYQEDAFNQLLDRFALDLPDTPASEDLTPYLTAADVGPLDDYCRNDGWDKQLKRWAEAKIAAARALREAAKGLS